MDSPAPDPRSPKPHRNFRVTNSQPYKGPGKVHRLVEKHSRHSISPKNPTGIVVVPYCMDADALPLGTETDDAITCLKCRGVSVGFDREGSLFVSRRGARSES